MTNGKRFPRAMVLGVALLLGASAGAPGAEVKPLLEHINRVGQEGKNNVEVARAWGALVQCGPDALLPILAALDTARSTPANWLRSAVESIVDRSLDRGE